MCQRDRTRVTMETAFNGFAAELTGPQAARLRAQPPVCYTVWKNEMLHADTITTPDFLGLTGTGGRVEEAVRRRRQRR